MSDDPTSVEDAVELFLEQRRRGDVSSPSAFAARHAELGPDLASALRSLLALEHVTQERGDDVLPECIGPFRIVREIGRGGMGVVLEAVEEPLHRRVALKVLPPELVSSVSARARFRREAELAARLDHPGIATIFGAGVDDDRPWIAMRYVEGRTLARSIAEARAAGSSAVHFADAHDDGGRVLALAVAARLAQVARALHAAHEHGVVHRDVKPSNIIVAPDGTPVLLDFGLAITEESDGHTLTRTGETAGTPAYLAPENVSGERVRPDAQSDVYALGVTLYECLTLRRPFDAPTPVALYRAILDGTPPGVRATNRAVPRDLAIVVATAMERDRARRYASAAALAADLEACVAGRPIAARPVPLAGRIARWARREPRQAVLAGSLALATLGTAVFAGTWWQSRAEVQAASWLTSERRYEAALHDGFGKLASNWLPEADAHFATALEIEPTSAEAIAGRALVYLKWHRDADAIAVLAAAPSTPAFDSFRALASGKLPDAEQRPEWFAKAPAIELFIDGMRLQKQIERSPRDERHRLAELALSRVTEAITRSRTTRMHYHVQRALLACMANDAAAIRSSAASLMTLWPNASRALFTAGMALSNVDAAAAIPLLERAIETDPTFGAAHQVLGNARRSQQDYEGAERALRRAIALDPRDADAYNSLGIVLSDVGCNDEARAAYLSAIALRPMFESWANLSLLEVARGDAEGAELALQNALRFAPRQSELRIMLADLRHDQGSVDAALSELDVAIGFDPGNARAWDLYSRWQTELGDFDASSTAAEISRELADGR